MNGEERTELTLKANQLIVVKLHLDSVIARITRLSEDLPPGNKGGDDMKTQLLELSHAREYLERAVHFLSRALAHDEQQL